MGNEIQNENKAFVITEIPADESLIIFISNKRGLPSFFVRESLRYNVIPLRELSFLTGKSIGSLTNNIRERIDKDNERVVDLNTTKPFPTSNFVFVVRDSKFDEFIKRVL